MKIVKSEKSEGKVIIFFEDGSTLEVDESDFLSMCLYDREELTQEECERLNRSTKKKKARIDAIKFISYKIRSSKEVCQRLQKLEYDDEVIDNVIDSLIKDKYLDDLDYAKRYARTKIKLNKISIKQLKIELSQKGISENIISSLQELYEIDEYSDIKRLLIKKYRVGDLQDNKIKLKAMKFLYSKGYEIELIQKVLDEVIRDVEN